MAHLSEYICVYMRINTTFGYIYDWELPGELIVNVDSKLKISKSDHNLVWIAYFSLGRPTSLAGKFNGDFFKFTQYITFTIKLSSTSD